MFLAALLKIKSTSQQKGILSLLPVPGKLKLPEGKNKTPTSTFLLHQTAFYFSWTTPSSIEHKSQFYPTEYRNTFGTGNAVMEIQTLWS